MQNIDVRFNASSNFAKVRADMAALEAQAASLNGTFSKGAYASPPAVVDPAKWRNATSAVSAASRAYRDAASSSGLLNTQQIRSVSEADKYTRALQRQKLGLRDMIKHQGIMKEVYRDQLRMQRMTAQYWGTDTAGKHITDITMPKNVPTELDNWRRKMGMFGNMAASAGTQVINLGKNMQWSGRQLTVGFTYPMVMFAGAAGLMAYKVESAFGSINKVYDLNAESINDATLREKELGELRVSSLNMAQKAAQDYGSAIEKTLAVEQELAATGLRGDNLLNSTSQVMRFSALGDIDPAATTTMVVALQTAFKDTIKDGNDLNNTLNFMNAASNASSLSLQDIAEATPRAATAIAQLGGTAQDMTTILVSMREAGVRAPEAANAIKSASTRIINPVPKAIEFYQDLGKNIRGAAIDIEALSQQSGGNLLQFLKLLGEEQKRIVGYNEKTGEVSEKETARLKAKGVATLFGTYQNNRLTASLVNLTDAYSGVENQTKKVMDLEAQSNAELQKMADNSLDLMMNNAAGKMRKAWETLRSELAEMGIPFLNVASTIVDALGSIVGGINGLSDGKKTLLMIGAAVLGIAGPTVMLAGLFLNLAGQFVKGIGSMAKFVGISKLFTKEEQAAALTTEAVNTAMQRQGTTVSTLAAEVNVLTQAYERAAIAARGVLAPTMPAGAAAARPDLSRTKSGGNFAAWSNSPLPAVDRAANLASIRSAQERLDLARQETVERTKATNQMRLYAAGGAVATAGMVTMMTTSNETANNIAKWAMIGGLVVPLVSNMSGLMGDVASRAKLAWTNQIGNARAAMNGTTAVTSMGRAMTVAGVAARGFGASLNAALGPVGWIVLGLTAVVGVFSTIRNHQKKVAEEQQAMFDKQFEANRVMQSSTRSIATNLGKAAGSYQQIVNAGGAASGGKGSQSQMLQSYNYYKSEEGMAETSALHDGSGKLLGTDALLTKVRDKYIDLQVLGGDTAEQARTDMQAMLTAAGASVTQAADMANDVYKKYGDVSKIDWTGPIADQTAALTKLANEAFSMESTMVSGGGYSQILTDFKVDENAKAALYQQAESSVQIFNQALSQAANPAEARKIIDQYMSAATSQWDSGFDRIMSMPDAGGGDDIKGLFAKYGIDSGQAFADAMRDNGAFEEAYLDLTTSVNVNPQLQGELKYLREFATEYEHAFINPLAESSWYLSDGVLTAATALQQYAAAGIGLNADEATDKLLKESDIYRDYADTIDRLNGMKMVGDMGRGAFTEKANYETREFLELQDEANVKGKALTKVINELNQQYGFKQGTNATQALKFLMGQVKVETDKASGAARNLDTTLAGIDDQNININIRENQIGGILQSGIEGLKADMVADANYIFTQSQRAQSDAMADAHEAQSSAMSDAQDRSSSAMSDRHDAAQRSLQRAQEAASRAMSERHEAAMRAFEQRWENRKDAVTEAYDKRISAVEKTIEAEKKADETRQRLFENEKRRLEQLAEKANTQIDFDIAVNTGDLDEAARIQNNAGAKSLNDQMDSEARRAELATARLIERLDKKRERLEKMRDRALKRLEKVEEAQRRHLERMQEAQQRAIQRTQEMQTRALEKQQEAQQEALERQQRAEQEALERRQQAEERATQRRQELAQKEHDMKLRLFEALPAASKKQLEKALQSAGLTLKDFGINTLDKRADTWGKYFEDHLTEHMRIAGAEISKDNMWEGVTKDIANKMLKGFGFASRGAFESFVKTGKLPKKDREARHDGGVVGSGKGSMGNLANRTTLSPSERMIRAQNGEFVVNKNDTAKNIDILHKINSGKVPFATDGIGGLATERTGDMNGFAPFGSTLGAQYHGFKHGISGSIANALRSSREDARARARAAKADGGRGSGVYIPGSGGRSRPTSPAPLSQGIHSGDGYRAVDIAVQVGKPVYAVEDGRVTSSYDIPGYESRRMIMGMTGPAVQDGMRSYGRVIKFQGDSGDSYVYAHLSKRAVAAGTKKIPGGSVIGYSGNAGNVQSSIGNGAHLHWGPQAGDPYAFLRNGGEIKYDNTMVQAHSGESILTKRLTSKFKESVEGGGSRGGDTYEVTLDLRGAMIKEEIDIEKAVMSAIDKKNAKVGRRRVVN